MNPAFRVALNETLGRPATPAEWFTYSAALTRMLGGTRTYIDTGHAPSRGQHDTILELHRSGASIRQIARKAGVSKSQVHRALSRILSC